MSRLSLAVRRQRRSFPVTFDGATLGALAFATLILGGLALARLTPLRPAAAPEFDIHPARSNSNRSRGPHPTPPQPCLENRRLPGSGHSRRSISSPHPA